MKLNPILEGSDEGSSSYKTARESSSINSGEYYDAQEMFEELHSYMDSHHEKYSKYF